MGLSTFPVSTHPLRQQGIKALHLDLCSSGTARGADSHHQGQPPSPTLPGALSELPSGQDHLKHPLKAEKDQEITQIHATGVEGGIMLTGRWGHCRGKLENCQTSWDLLGHQDLMSIMPIERAVTNWRLLLEGLPREEG